MMHDLLSKICNGHGTARDVEMLEELSIYVKEASLCGLGMSAPNPLMSTLRYFKNEYIEQLKKSDAIKGGVHG
ncbi:MAG: hypothetical protein HQL13_07875 [Candidatus Omnitrophica bacterium]|nr:hypothetical protein [Candidatus Omnitrophota bacterium]